MSICFLLDVCYIIIWQYVQSAEMKKIRSIAAVDRLQIKNNDRKLVEFGSLSVSGWIFIRGLMPRFRKKQSL